MNSVIVDTNVLVYIYSGIPNTGRKYAELLGDLSTKYNLVIPKLVYGELSLIFSTSKQLNKFLSDTGLIIGDIGPEAYIIAAKRWDKYNKRRVLICQKCGKKIEKLTCKACNAEAHIRQHILTDFIIGAYAFQTSERKLVTNDKGYFSTYFSELTIISTDS
jgi:predicted nucleic acid-binding protein